MVMALMELLETVFYKPVRVDSTQAICKGRASEVNKALKVKRVHRVTQGAQGAAR